MLHMGKLHGLKSRECHATDSEVALMLDNGLGDSEIKLSAG